jgi:hypothetical protein
MKSKVFMFLFIYFLGASCKVKKCPSIEDQENRKGARYNKRGLIKK